MIFANYTDNLVLFANTPAQARPLLQAAGGIDLYVNANGKKKLCFKQKEAI